MIRDDDGRFAGRGRPFASGGGPPRVEFRRAETVDAVAIRDLMRAAYAKYVERLGREPLPMTADHERAVRKHDVWVLLDPADGLIATLELIPHPDHLLIENVAVRPDRQGQGIGKELLRFAERETTRRGHGELRLYTNAAMVENIALYTALGYRETHRRHHGGSDIVFMSKRIESPDRD